MVMDGTAGTPWSLPIQVVVQSSAPTAANASTIGINGTTTVNTGGGKYWGCNALTLGTLWTVALYDINGTSTKILSASVSVGAIGSLALPGPAGVPVIYAGALVAVTAGTLAGSLNVLWD